MAKITVTDTQGLNQIKSGNGVVLQHTPTVSDAVALVTANTASLPGVYTIAGGSAAEVKMPTASESLGGVFVFRSTSAQAHFLTGSAEAAGTKVFVLGDPAAGNAKNGSKLTLQGVVGASVALISDGVNFIVLPGSGSVAFSGT